MFSRAFLFAALLGSATAARVPALNANAANGLKCAACEYVIGKLETYLADPDFQAKIMTVVVADICPAIAKEVPNATCVAAASAAIPAAASYLTTNYPPETACTDLGECTSAAAVEAAALARLPHESLCDLCVEVVTYVDNKFVANKTADEIVSEMEEACGFLPGNNLTAECDKYVDQYGKTAARMAQFLSPQQACQTVHVCDSGAALGELRVAATSAPMTRIVQKSKGQLLKGGECAFCKFLVAEAKNVLSENKTVAAVITVAEKLCSLAPAAYQTHCATIIENFGAEAVGAIVNLLDPETDCEKVGACSSEAGALVGGKGSFLAAA